MIAHSIKDVSDCVSVKCFDCYKFDTWLLEGLIMNTKHILGIGRKLFLLNNLLFKH